MTAMHRVGLIVPSSNTTMETEVPALLRARERVRPEDTFSFHSARLRMEDVTPEALRAMNEETDARRRSSRTCGRTSSPPRAWSRSWRRARGATARRRRRSSRSSSRSMPGRPSSRPRARSSTRCMRSARAGSGSSRPISRSSRSSSSRTSRTRASRSQTRSASRSPRTALSPHSIRTTSNSTGSGSTCAAATRSSSRRACRCARSRCSRRWSAAAGCRRCPPRRRRRGRSWVRSTSSRSLRVPERSFVRARTRRVDGSAPDRRAGANRFSTHKVPAPAPGGLTHPGHPARTLVQAAPER